jgi:hypothetical protein
VRLDYAICKNNRIDNNKLSGVSSRRDRHAMSKQKRKKEEGEKGVVEKDKKKKKREGHRPSMQCVTWG